MAFDFVRTVVSGVAVGAGLLFVYFWFRGIVDFLTARREQASWQRNKSGWLHFNFDPDSYSGVNRQRVLSARHSWRQAMICSFVGVVSAMTTDFLSARLRDPAGLSPQTVVTTRLVLVAVAVAGIVAFVGVCARALIARRSQTAASVDGENARPRAIFSILWAFASLAVAALAITLLVGHIGPTR
jgi:hypothetical protein